MEGSPWRRGEGQRRDRRDQRGREVRLVMRGLDKRGEEEHSDKKGWRKVGFDRAWREGVEGFGNSEWKKERLNEWITGSVIEEKKQPKKVIKMEEPVLVWMFSDRNACEF